MLTSRKQKAWDLTLAVTLLVALVALIVCVVLLAKEEDDINVSSDAAASSDSPEITDAVGYDYTSERWYQDLLTLPADTAKTLTTADFVNGTLRIRAPGRYVLTEDVDFAPRADANFWPDYGDADYPMGPFFLGFFAAITVEASDVWLDLNGHTIRQSDLFYRKQRFFNVIELADRVFDAHEGVLSMNFQWNDKLHFHGGSSDFSHPSVTVGAPNFGRRVLISNGILGQSSHNGIHSNFGSDLVLKDLVVKDFEVAGIQLNGVNNVAVVDTVVGPNHQQVPVYSALSNAIHMSRMIDYVRFSLPRLGELHENATTMRPALEGLLDEEITFVKGARLRPEGPVSIGTFFDRLQKALSLWFQWFEAEDKVALNANLTAADAALLSEFRTLVENPSGLSDGSVVYGVKLHRRGAGVGTPGTQDEPFYGPDLEVQNVTLENVRVQKLRARPIITPALVAADGTVIQGPVRDTFDVLSATLPKQDESLSDSGLLRNYKDAYYHGDVLHDAYGAMWKLSNSFYNTYIVNSDCANFGSNLTAPFTGMMFQLGAAYTGSEPETRCPMMPRTRTLRGRDVSMLQRRLFGSIAMTQQFYEWMAPKESHIISLEDVLSTPTKLRDRKREMHTFVCHGDAMHHPMKGVLGLVIEFHSRVRLSNLSISDLGNTGDSDHWLCDGSVGTGGLRKLYKSTENTKLSSFSGGHSMGADTRGLQIGKSKNVRIESCDIDMLSSTEGVVVGVDLLSDVTGDKLDWETWPQQTLNVVSLNVGMHLKAASGSKVFPLKTQQSTGIGGTLEALPGIKVHHQFDTPRVSFTMGAQSFVPHDFASSNQPLNGTYHRERFMAALRGDVELIYKFRNKSVSFLEETFGLKTLRLNGSVVTLSQAVSQVEWWENVKFDRVNSPGDGSMWAVGLVNDGVRYNINSMCWQGSPFSSSPTCRGDLANRHGSEVIDITMVYMPTNSEMLYGTFGKEQGYASNSGPAPYNIGDILLTGMYLFVNLPTEFDEYVNMGEESTFGPGVLPIEYYAGCPISTRSSPAMDFMSQFRYHTMINCELDSPVLGRGKTVGTWTWYSEPEDAQEYTRHRLAGTSYMTFDDVVPRRPTRKVVTVATNGQMGSIGQGTQVTSQQVMLYNATSVQNLPTLLRDLTDSPAVVAANGGRANNYYPDLVVQVAADGEIEEDPMTLGLPVHPLGKSRGMFVNEAFQRFAKRWLGEMMPVSGDTGEPAQGSSEQREAFLRSLRADFIDHYLVSYMGLADELNTPLSSARFQDEPVDNTLELGGGNAIVPYVINENAGTHAVVWAPKSGTTRGLAGDDRTSALESTPVYEGGFALLVGRAGVRVSGTPVSGANAGLSLPYGTMLRYGYRVFAVEAGTESRGSQRPTKVIMHFKDKFPAEPNFLTHYELLQSCRIVYPLSLQASHNNSLCVGFEQVVPGGGIGMGGVRYLTRWTFVEQTEDVTSRPPFTWQGSLMRGTGSYRWAYSFEDAANNGIPGGMSLRTTGES